MRNISLIIILALSFLQACGPKKVKPSTNSIYTSEKLLHLDLVLKNNLKLVQTEGVKDESGRLEARVTLENEKNKDIWADVQITFKNAAGEVVEETSWEAVNWHRRSVNTYKRKSLNSEAQDYRITFRKTK